MTELSNSQYELYTQALKQPSLLTEEDLLQLIVRYPYSQPLIYAYERRKVEQGESSSNKSLALLYSPSSSWLWTFLNREVVSKEEEVPTSDQNNVVSTLAELVESSEPNELVSRVVDDLGSAEKDELDMLVNQGSVLADYFIFDSKSEVKEEVNSPSSEEIEELEDVSLYNDDLMPYSFRWWLHKTRLEYADSYQPFALKTLKSSNDSIVDFGKLDESILDQQIKEHIIHFQDPEAKLSEQVKNKPIEHVQPKKTDPIIERFIREEPIIQAPSAEKLNNENMARQSAEDNYVLVTETLANIYKDQGLIPKAIEVFNKLILKYPEKKSYFASRIQELEKNI